MIFLRALPLVLTALALGTIGFGQTVAFGAFESQSEGHSHPLLVSTETETLRVELTHGEIMSRAAVFRVIDSDGAWDWGTPSTETFEGSVSGEVDSFVAASKIQGEWILLLKRSRNAPLMIASGLADAVSPAGIPVVMEVPPDRANHLATTCGQATQAQPIAQAASRTPIGTRVPFDSIPMPQGATPRIQIALDSDYEFFQRFGPNPLDVLEAQIGWMHLVSRFWEYEAGVRIEVSSAVVRTDPNAPDYPWTVAGNWDAKFGSYWGSATLPEHQLVYAFLDGFVGGNVQGATGTIGALCERTPDFKMWGLTKTRHVISGADLSPTERLIVTAHEIGHALGATHPLPANANYGVMSFGASHCFPDCFWVYPQTQNEISAYVNSQLGSCLTDSVPAPQAPSVTGVSPDTLSWHAVHGWSPGTLIQLTGPGLEHTAEITIGNRTLEAHELVFSGPNSIGFYASPNHLPALGVHTLEVHSPGGTAQAMVTVSETNPPALEIDAESIFSPLDLNVYAYSAPGDLVWVLYNSLGDTIPFGPAYSLLSPRSELGSGVADSNGHFNLPALPFTPAMLHQTIYVQCVIIDAEDGEVRASDPTPLLLTPN